jgi:hypothetical protein
VVDLIYSILVLRRGSRGREGQQREACHRVCRQALGPQPSSRHLVITEGPAKHATASIRAGWRQQLKSDLIQEYRVFFWHGKSDGFPTVSMGRCRRSRRTTKETHNSGVKWIKKLHINSYDAHQMTVELDRKLAWSYAGQMIGPSCVSWRCKNNTDYFK